MATITQCMLLLLLLLVDCVPSHQIVLLQVQLQDRVFHGGKHKADVFCV